MSVAIWAWHLPAAFELALRSRAWHVVEHASFFGAGLLFWWPVIEPWPSRPRWPRWAMVPYLLLADMQNTALAALLVFSDRVLYPSYARGPNPLDDQAAAGVLMWVPMSFAYLIPAGLLTAQILSPSAGSSRSQSSSSRRLAFGVQRWPHRIGPRSTSVRRSIRAGHVNRQKSPKGHEAPLLTAK